MIAETMPPFMHRQARDPVEQMESSSEDQEAQIQATLAEEVKRLRAQVAQTAVASCLVPRASCLVRRASCEVDTCVSSIDYTTNKVVLSSTDLNEHRRLLGQLRKCGGQATIFKALKF